MTVNITYNLEEDKVYITNSSGCARSGICLYMSELNEEDIIKLLKNKRGNKCLVTG